jgi:hypothetical protein
VLRVAFDRPSAAGAEAALSPRDYLAFVQERLRRARVEAVKAVDPTIASSIADGVLLFKETRTAAELRRAMERDGFSREEIDDLLLRPQFVLPEGESWQRDGFRLYEQHLSEVVDECKEVLADGVPPVAVAGLEQTAIGSADVPFFDAGADFVPRGGAYVLLARSLLILPMWFAALRRLPRPWNEQDLEGEALRRFLGAAAIAIKAGLGDTMVGYYSYTHELLSTSELAASGRLLPLGLDRLARLAAQLEQRNDLLSCERFIVGHELAHVLMGHSEWLRSWGPPSRWSPAQHVERARQLRDAEFGADVLGLMVLVKLTPAASTRNLKPGYVFNGDERLDALIVLFMLFHVLEDPADGSAEAATHPTALQRLRALAGLLVKRTAGPGGEARFMAEIWPAIEQDMDVLRTMLIGAIVQAKPRIIRHADVEALR